MTVTVEGCTFKDCVVPAYDGTSSAWTSAGIQIVGSSSSLTVRGGTFDGCRIEEPTGSGSVDGGGAILAQGGASVVIERDGDGNGCTFKDCFSPTSGGAIMVGDADGLLKISGAAFQNTRAGSAARSGYGGAIYCPAGTFEDTTFEGCETVGGAVGSSSGGAIALFSSATFKNVTITGCSAFSGGAVYWRNAAAGTTLQMTDVSIDGCSASGYGGAFYIDNASGTFTLEGGSVKNCTASSNAVLHFLSGATTSSFSLSGVDISDCTATDSSTTYAELIYAYGGNVSTIGGNSTITCAASSNGASPMILARTSSTLLVESGSVLDGNGVARADGCPIVLVKEGVFTLAGTLKNAKAADSTACGVVASGGAFVMIDGGSITGCASTGNANRGLAVEVAYASTFEMEGGTITGNGTAAGAGVLVFGEFWMTGGTITGNSISGSAGAVQVCNGGTFNWDDGEITGNTPSVQSDVYVESGGTLAVTKGALQLDLTGGVYIESGATASDTNGSVPDGTYYALVF